MCYRLKKDEERAMFECFVAENLATISAGMHTKERIGYIDKYNKLWGYAENKKDNRSAKEIISDTFKRHGLRIKKHKEAVDEPV